MKNLTIQFAGYGLQDESAIQGNETSAELLSRVATNDLKYTGVPLFDYKTGTMWKVVEIVDAGERDKQIAELQKQLKKRKKRIAELESRLKEQSLISAKQVCDKIVKYATRDEWFDNRTLSYEIRFIVSADLLDQIERGEK